MADRIDATEHHDGQLIIYRRLDPKTKETKPTWYYDIKFPRQKRIRHQSTKHTDFTDALMYAEQQYRNLSVRVATGIQIHAWTFERICKQAIKYYEERADAGLMDPDRYARLVRTSKNCLIPYFNELGKDFISINTLDIEDWVTWRLSKGKMRTVSTQHYKHGEWIPESTVTLGTINYELQMLRMVYDYAKKKELILPAQIPQIKSIKEDQRSQRRPHITVGEWSKISNYLHHHYIDDIPDRLGNLRQIYRFYHTLHKEMWIMLWETGLRVGELRTLRWGDIEDREIKLQDGKKVNRLILSVSGKVGLRHTVAQPYCKVIFDRWRECCHEHDISTDMHDYVFRHPPFTNMSKDKVDQPIGTTNQTFQGVLRKLDMLPPKGKEASQKHKKGLSIYSLRHGYITRQLIAGVNISALSKNVGTSIQTLTTFYDHALSTDFIDEITRFEVYGTDDKLASPIEAELDK